MPSPRRPGRERRRASAGEAEAAQRARVVELLRKAIEPHALLESGEAANRADISLQEGITRPPRVTQVMGMLRLAPEIQKHILSMPDMARRPTITQRALRPIAQLLDATHQRREFEALFDGTAPKNPR